MRKVTCLESSVDMSRAAVAHSVGMGIVKRNFISIPGVPVVTGNPAAPVF